MKGQQRLILDTILLGVVGALGAQLLMILLHGSEALFMTWNEGVDLCRVCFLISGADN